MVHVDEPDGQAAARVSKSASPERRRPLLQLLYRLLARSTIRTDPDNPGSSASRRHPPTHRHHAIGTPAAATPGYRPRLWPLAVAQTARRLPLAHTLE